MELSLGHQMSNFLEEMSKDPVQIYLISVVGLIFTVGSVVMAFYFYVKSKRHRCPKYMLKSVNLIDGKYKSFAGFKVFYRESEVLSVTSTKIAFWNSGKETIRREDLSKVESLRLVVDEGEILDALILGQTKAANASSLEIIEGAVKISFDFLDHDEGVVVQLLHTATKSSNVRVAGTIIGTKSIQLVSPLPSADRVIAPLSALIRSRISRRTLGWILIVAGSIIPISFIWLEARPKNGVANNMSGLAGGLILAFLYISTGISVVRKYLPQDLVKFFDE